MGGIISKIQNKYFNNQILMIGLDSCGKTTILLQLNPNNILNNSYLGLNYETLEYKEYKIVNLDLGGSNRIESLKLLFEGTKGLIYVIDSIDFDRYNESIKNLKDFLNIKNDFPILLLLNKADFENGIKISDLEKDLNFLNNNYKIFQISAAKNEGINEGLDWLFENLK